MPRKSIFDDAAESRQQEQERIEAQLTNKASNRKEHLNISLPKEYKDKLFAYAKKRCLSASVLIQMWIDEHCD